MNREDYVLRDNQGSFTYKFVIIGLIGVRVRQRDAKRTNVRLPGACSV